jgi:hypothetical protein
MVRWVCFFGLFYPSAGFLDILVILDEKEEEGMACTAWECTGTWILDLGCLFLHSNWGGGGGGLKGFFFKG